MRSTAIALCIFSLVGCSTGPDKERRCAQFSEIYAGYLATTEWRPVSKEEAAAAAAAAMFLRVSCGWTGPKGGPVDTNGVPVIFPP